MIILSNTDVGSWLGNTGAHAFRDNHHEVVPFRFRNSFVPGLLIGPKNPVYAATLRLFLIAFRQILGIQAQKKKTFLACDGNYPLCLPYPPLQFSSTIPHTLRPSKERKWSRPLLTAEEHIWSFSVLLFSCRPCPLRHPLRVIEAGRHAFAVCLPGVSRRKPTTPCTELCLRACGMAPRRGC